MLPEYKTNNSFPQRPEVKNDWSYDMIYLTLKSPN